MPLSSELILIGDELLEGRIHDKNGPWLARFLHREGCTLKRVTLVSDLGQELEDVIRLALSRSQLVITSGGLGPTSDDTAKLSLAQALNVGLKKNPLAEQLVSAHYARIGKTWAQNLNHYADLPEGVLPLENSEGLAPGLLHEARDRAVVMFPGVPREFRAMAQAHLPMQLKRLAPDLTRHTSLTIRTYGLPEEKIFGELVPTLWKDLERFGKLSSLPQILGVDLVLNPRGPVDYLDWVEEVRHFLRATPLAPHIWQWGEQELPAFLVDLLAARGATVSFAESCTGGLLSSLITDVPGSSRVFPGAFVTYSNQVKQQHLEVESEVLERFGAVSEECAQQMAFHVRQKIKSDYALALSGIAGPGGGSPEKPVGTLALAWVGPAEQGSQLLRFHGQRTDLKQRFAYAALFQLLKLLI